MSEWWEPDEPEVTVVEKRSALKGRADLAPKGESLSVAAQREVIAEVEGEIYHRVMKTMDGVAAFGELDPEKMDEMPEGWVEAFGEREAEVRHRLARAAWMPGADAPVGLKLAANTFVGLAKARAVEKKGPPTLNLIAVSMPGPPQVYESVELPDK